MESRAGNDTALVSSGQIRPQARIETPAAEHGQGPDVATAVISGHHVIAVLIVAIATARSSDLRRRGPVLDRRLRRGEPSLYAYVWCCVVRVRWSTSPSVALSSPRTHYVPLRPRAAISPYTYSIRRTFNFKISHPDFCSSPHPFPLLAISATRHGIHDRGHHPVDRPAHHHFPGLARRCFILWNELRR